MNTPTGWEGLLDDGESILWQGRPDGGFALEIGGLISGVFGLFFGGFAIFWMSMASMAPGPFWLFGLPFLFVGCSIVFSGVFGPTWRRRNTWYTLTDRRAFIATRIPFKGRQLKSYPITPDTELEFIDGDFTTINFAKVTHHHRRNRTRNHGGMRRSYQTTSTVGFERIRDGRKVYSMMRNLQKEHPSWHEASS